MGQITRFTIELHPASKNGRPGAWRATGFDGSGRPVPFAVGFGARATDSLREAEINGAAEPTEWR